MAKIKYFYTSNIGRCRKANQDNLYCDGVFLPSENHGTDGIREGTVQTQSQPVFAVFDGMGGEERGEMAAYLAAREMAKFSFGQDMGTDLQEFCRQANAAICRYTRENRVTTMGTTAAILRFTDEYAGLCNVGDSKIFLYSKGALNQLSYDHVGLSVGGRKPPLTQNLGIPETELIIDPYVAMGAYAPGDAFLICSDGLTDMVTQERIQEILKKKQAAETLLQEALDNGGKDNVSFILIYVKKKSIFERLKEVCVWRRK